MRSIQDMISQEVLVCVSSLVSTLANGMPFGKGDLNDLVEQARDLASPIPDYEEAAIQAGWTKTTGGMDHANEPEMIIVSSWQELCEDFEIDPIDSEVFEHWAVTDWLADKLAAAGEKVDKDFAGMCVWARTTTGQAIYADAVIERIYRDMIEA